MWDNQVFQILVYSALVFFNLVFIVAFFIGVYTLLVIGTIKGKIEEVLEQTKITAEKVAEAAASASEVGVNLASTLAPLAILKGLFGGKKKQSTGFFSKFFG